MILKIFANIEEVLCKTFTTVVTFSRSIFLMLLYGLENELQTHRVGVHEMTRGVAHKGLFGSQSNTIKVIIIR